MYLFYGPEEFVKKSAVDQLRAALLPPGLELLNEDVLENVDATAIIESAETLPVMCDQRFVLVKDWPPLFKGGDQEADKLEKWLPNAPQSCVLVFYAGGAEPNRATKVTKALYEYAQVTEFPLLDDEELGRRLGKAFREQGKKVEKDAVSQLIFLAGRDLNRLLGEVQKLANYVGDAEVVTAGDVRAIVTPSTEAGVFLMIDAMMEGRAREAYNVLGAMTDAGENRVQILATLIWQMRLIAHVAIQRDKRMTLPQIQATIRERPFAVRKLRSTAAWPDSLGALSGAVREMRFPRLCREKRPDARRGSAGRGDAGNLRRKTENLTEENETKTGDAPSKLYIRE